MNYIEEELRRQAEAFSRLLGGGTMRETDAAEADSGRGKAGTAEGGGALRARPRLGEPEPEQDAAGEMAAWNQALLRRRDQILRQAAGALGGLTAAEIEAGPARGARADRAATAEERSGSGFAPGQGSDGSGAVRRAAGISGGGGTEFAAPAGTALAVDGGLSAGELSQAFQRDARRYDGGYPLY